MIILANGAIVKMLMLKNAKMRRMSRIVRSGPRPFSFHKLGHRKERRVRQGRKAGISLNSVTRLFLGLFSPFFVKSNCSHLVFAFFVSFASSAIS